MGQTPSKYLLPSAPYGSSQAVNTTNPVQPLASNPQTPLTPPNFQDPGTAVNGQTQQAPQGNPFANGYNWQQYVPSQYQQYLKGLFLFILLLCVPSARATTTVTGNVKNLGTGSVTNTFVRFWLRGCNGNQPRVAGTGIIAPSQGGVFYFDIVASSSGAISGTLYSTRDSTGNNGGEIECGGSTTSEWYGMQAFTNGKGGPEVPIQAKNGSTIDVSNVTPITTNPVVTAPTGDGTYLRLDAGNSPVTGPLVLSSNLTENGTTTLNGGTLNGTYAGNPTLRGNVTASAGITTPNINNVIYVDGYAGSDIFAQANTAASSATAPALIVIPPGTYNGVTSTLNCKDHMVFSGYGVTVNWTGTSGNAMYCDNAFHSVIEGFQLVGTGAAGTTGLYVGGNAGAPNGQTSDNTFRDLQFGTLGVAGSSFANCVTLDGTTNKGTYNDSFENNHCFNATGVGMKIVPTTAGYANANTFVNNDVERSGSDCWQIDGADDNTIIGSRGETCGGWGLNFSGASATTANNIFGTHFESNTSGDVNFANSNVTGNFIFGGETSSTTPMGGSCSVGFGNIFAPTDAAGCWQLLNGTNFNINGTSSKLSVTGGPVQAVQVLANQGTACTNAELALSAGWGTSPTVTAVAGTGQTCEWTITSGTGTPTANPTITDTLTNALPSASTVCRATLIATASPASIPADETTLSAIAPVFTAYLTPGASVVYKFSRTCGP